MPTITESAKDLAYTAFGFNVLAYDELKARLAERGVDITKQVEIARARATASRARWQGQFEDAGEQLQSRIRPVAEPVNSAIAPVRKTVEETVTRFAPARRKAAEAAEAAQDAVEETVAAAVDTVEAVVETPETPKARTRKGATTAE